VSDGLVDRLTGQAVRAPDEDQLGRYALSGMASGYWLDSRGGPGEQSMPIRLVVDNVAAVAQHVTDLLERRAPMSELAQQTPLMTDKDSRIEPRSFDKHLINELPHLEKVCRDPDARLQTGHVEVPVGKARRTTWRTVEHLAAHSETWAARRLHGVEPARLLVPVQIPDFEFYENQLVAALVRHLWRDQQERSEELESIEDLITRAENFLRDTQDRPGYRERARLYHLIENLVADSSADERLLEQMQRASDLREALTRLLAEKLSRIVRTPYAGPPERRPTNLFLYNDDYRGCARLWDAWASQEQEASAQHDDAVAWCRSFARYTVLLMVRAIYQLTGPAGEEPLVPSRFGPGEGGPQFRYRGRLVSFRWNPDDTLVVSLDERPVLRVVPLPHALTRPGDAKSIEDPLDAVAAARPAYPYPTAVVYPGEATERGKLPLPLRLAAHDCHGGHAGRLTPALVPVSPSDIDSVGRITRLLRRAIDGTDAKEYPPTVPCTVDGVATLTTRLDWVALEAGALMVLRPPRQSELNELTSSLAEVRSKSVHPRQRELEREQLTRLQSDLRKASEHITRLTICPVCLWTPLRPEHAMQVRNDSRTYRCACERCGSSWEIRQCANCRDRYAVLMAAGLEDNLGGDGDHLDRVFAQDLLAAPCWMKARVYLCPHCGNCPESDAPAMRSACNHCRLPAE
jgi:hypothetical protein